MDGFVEHSQQYQLESWIVCPKNNTIVNQAGTLSIDNKSMQVLLFLIQQAGNKVTKSQVIEHVWKGRFVTDDILSVTISKIRKALGDKARSPTFIKTLPGEGYILIAKVNKIECTEQVSSNKNKSFNVNMFVLILVLITCLAMYFIITDDDSPSSQISINSIAVLPFEDLSSAQDNQYFTDGLSDAIINQLSQIKQLKVISRYSSFTYRGMKNTTEIGQALQVDTLLDGSVQKIGEHVRINVRVFSTKNGQQLWANTFDSDLHNVFELQDNISATIQEIIQPDYAPINSNSSLKSAKKISAQAYEWYLMGQYHWRQRNPVSLNKAVTYFKHSLELEPDYAEAHLGLGITYAFLHTYGSWYERRAIEAAEPHIMKALALKPNSSAALAAKGMILSDKAKARLGGISSSLYQQAQQAFIRSLELDNNATTHHWYSTLLTRLGKVEEAQQHLEQAIELDPLSSPLKRSLSFLLSSMAKQDSAERMYQQAIILDPDYFSHPIESTHVFRHTQQSIIALAKWHSDNLDLFTSCSSDEYCEQLVLAYLSVGANDASNKVLAKMRSKHGHFFNSLNLIDLGLKVGLKGQEQNILSIKERLALRQPQNRSVLYDLAVGQFRTENFGQAKTTLLKLYPEWLNPASIKLSDITADNYMALVLYAVTLSNLNDQQVAEILLQNVQKLIKQDKEFDTVFDKVQAEFTLAEINAQLDNKPQALHHIATALEMGWVESNNREWWSLQNNHLLRPLHEAHEFKLLLKQHQENLNQLRIKVDSQLSKS